MRRRTRVGGRTGWAALVLAVTLSAAAPAARAAHPGPLPVRTQVPLGSAVWYACADPAYGGPAALACKVQPVAPQTTDGLAAAYANTFTTYFDRYTPENEFKMLWTEPAKGRFDFAVADRIARFAQARGKHIHGHALVYAAANPGWVDKPFLFGWSRASLLNAMTNHIRTLVTHFATGFPGVVDEWDVVNEPFLDDGSRDQNVYQRTIGNDWIEQAFRAANAADPGALLYLNEFNADTPGPRQQAVLALVRDFVARGVPIDGVGLEMHIGATGSYPTLEQLETVMGQYRDLGLRVALTELDALKPLGPWDGTAQRAAYDVVAEACREMSNCVSVNVWGVADQYSWRGVDQHADLVWTTFSPKNTYTDVRCRLNDPMPATGTWTPVACPAQQAPLAAAMTMPTGPTSGPSTGSEPAVGPPPGG